MSNQSNPTPSLTIQQFTSSEAGAWSNSYLISGASEAALFDVFLLHEDSVQLADRIAGSGKRLKAVWISHAHPDHYSGLDVITERFPEARILSTPAVVADMEQDGPGTVSLLQSRLGPQAPARLVVPEPRLEPALHVDGIAMEVAEFGEAESKHTATLYIPALKALLSADLVYNQAHLYVAERHSDSWLVRLEELEKFASNKVSTIYPGHGPASDLQLIAQTRRYLHDFATAIRRGDAAAAEREMLAKYADYHVRQFLSVFSIPAHFPLGSEFSVAAAGSDRRP